MNEPEPNPAKTQSADPQARPDADIDLAGEHYTPSIADQDEGDEKRQPEPESPEGLAGMDP